MFACVFLRLESWLERGRGKKMDRIREMGGKKEVGVKKKRRWALLPEVKLEFNLYTSLTEWVLY